MCTIKEKRELLEKFGFKLDDWSDEEVREFDIFEALESYTYPQDKSLYLVLNKTDFYNIKFLSQKQKDEKHAEFELYIAEPFSNCLLRFLYIIYKTSPYIFDESDELYTSLVARRDVYHYITIINSDEDLEKLVDLDYEQFEEKFFDELLNDSVRIHEEQEDVDYILVPNEYDIEKIEKAEKRFKEKWG